MSETNSNHDLEEFRQQWKKELDKKLKQREPIDKTGPGSTSKIDLDGTHTPTHKVNQFSDYSLPPVSAEHALVPLHDDNSCDGFEVNTFKPRQETTSSDAASEYFPFKILTQFLNEAPKRIGSKQTKAALKSPPATLSKKRYFQKMEEKASKKTKEEIDIKDTTSEKKGTEGKEESKKMLDLFIADLVSYVNILTK